MESYFWNPSGSAKHIKILPRTYLCKLEVTWIETLRRSLLQSELATAGMANSGRVGHIAGEIGDGPNVGEIRLNHLDLQVEHPDSELEVDLDHPAQTSVLSFNSSSVSAYPAR